MWKRRLEYYNNRVSDKTLSHTDQIEDTTTYREQNRYGKVGERENEWCCIFQLNVCSGSSGWRRDDAVDDDEDEENIFLVLQNSREENKIERERERRSKG